MTDRQPQIPGMGRKEFDEFKRLCIAHRHIFDHRKSPDADELDAFNGLLRQIPCVIAMFRESALQEAIERLEKGFQKELKKYNRSQIPVPLADGSLPPDEEPSGKMKQGAKLEREVRFIMRCGFLSWHHLDERHIFFKTNQDKHRSQAIKHLEAAHRELKWLVPDPFLAKGYLAPEAQPSIERLVELTPVAIKHLKDAFPQYPVQRDSRGHHKGDRGRKEDTQKLISMHRRQLLDRLFDACRRCYAYLSPEVASLLLSCDWLGYGSQYIVTWKDVTAFRKRKIDVEQERAEKIDPIPYEEFRFVDPWKDQKPVQSPLGGAEPGFEYDAPWLRF